jgi:hypothetical protein
VVELQEKGAADQLLYVTLHVFHHDVESLEVVHVLGLENFDNFYNRWVV